MSGSVSPDQRTEIDPAVLADAVSSAVAAHHDEPGPLLEVLHAVQAELGWVPPRPRRLVADRLNLSRAEVHGVVTFYPTSAQSPPADDQVRVCAPRPASPVGARDLVDARASSGSASTSASTTADGSLASSTRSSASATARSGRPSRSTACSTAGSTPPVSTLLTRPLERGTP